MGGFKLGGMTLGSIFKKPETTLYPFEKKPAPAGLKGTVGLDPATCILCGICAKRCPCFAIEVDKKARTWAINHFQCVQCGSCILECPKKCLTMIAEAPHVTGNIEPEVIVVPEQPKKAKPAKEAAEPAPVAEAVAPVDPELEAKLANMDPEKAAKVRAAMAAKKAKEAKAE